MGEETWDFYRDGISIALAIHSLDPIRSLDLFTPLIPYAMVAIRRRFLSPSLIAQLIPPYNLFSATYGLGAETRDYYGNPIRIYYGISIAFAVRSVDPSLFSQLISYSSWFTGHEGESSVIPLIAPQQNLKAGAHWISIALLVQSLDCTVRVRMVMGFAVLYPTYKLTISSLRQIPS